MSEIDFNVCEIIDTIASRVAETLPCEPLAIQTSVITGLDKENAVLDEDDICNRILKYKNCYDFATLPKPFFFYKRFPEYYTIDVGGVSYEKFIELIEGADDYKNCKTTEERREVMRNRLVRMLCYHYKIKGYLPQYEEKYWIGTKYLEFNEIAYIKKNNTEEVITQT